MSWVWLVVVGALGAVLGYLSHERACQQRIDQAVRNAHIVSNRALANARGHNLGFVSALAHDVTAPLRAQGGFGEILVRMFDKAREDPAALDIDRGKDFAERIVAEAARLNDMITELRSFAVEATGNGSVKCRPAEEVIEGAIERLQTMLDAEGAHLELDMELPKSTRLKTSVGRVLQNLVDNAVKYAGDEPPRLEVCARRDNGSVVIEVRDAGMGFPPEDAEVIFGMLRQLHPHQERSRGGFGMGLALCREIVEERLGGRIEASSAGPGLGATFRVVVPNEHCKC